MQEYTHIHGYLADRKGISLVALIITIIVMVILAGIIIVSAVMDGGVIDRAQEAMKEKERAEVEELIISSYIYGKTASTNTQYAYIDLKETSKNIYENLTDNGFKIKGKDGEYADKAEDFYTGGDKIEIEVEGNHGEYEAEVNENGLVGGVTSKPEGTGGLTKNEFEIDVAQNNYSNRYENINMTPKITADMFTKEESLTIACEFLNKMTNRTDIDTFDEAVLLMYNMSSGESDKKYFSYEEIESDYIADTKNETPTEDDIINYISKGTYATLQEFIAESYTYIVSYLEKATLKVNGVDVTNSENTRFSEEQVRYKVEENGTYEIEINLNGKIGKTIVTVTDIIDFEISITDDNKTNKAILTITPNITADMFSKEDGINAVSNMFKQNFESLQDVNLYIYNLQQRNRGDYYRRL